jgi:hypothetical protein
MAGTGAVSEEGGRSLADGASGARTLAIAAKFPGFTAGHDRAGIASHVDLASLFAAKVRFRVDRAATALHNDGHIVGKARDGRLRGMARSCDISITWLCAHIGDAFAESGADGMTGRRHFAP